MTRKLNESDRAAIDMIFDRLNAAGANGNGDGFVAMTGAVDDRRLTAVRSVLTLLDQMPSPEPSSDLTVRTLQRIATAAPATAPQAIPGLPAFVNPNQPMA